jgi:periplasmic protein TonB
MPDFIGGMAGSAATRARKGRGPGAACARGAASAAQLALVGVIVVLLAAAAWWWFMGRPGAGPIVASAPTAATPGADAATEPAAAATELTTDQLYKAARSAMSENRMVAPAGNNALEYYLRILQKQPDDSGATDALRELFPFATGSAEDQINQGNFDEATRIMGLLAKADPSNYTLTILRSKLDAKKKQNDREQVLAAQKEAAATAAAKTAQAGTAAPSAGTTAASEAAPPAAAAAAPTQKPVEVAKATPAPVAAPPPAPEPVGETRDVRVVTAPRPAYPPLAVRNKQQGWVEVEFTVAADGQVQNARVVNSNPSSVFDHEAVRAIEQAKFEPRLEKGQAVASTLRRRIEFKLGG